MGLHRLAGHRGLPVILLAMFLIACARPTPSAPPTSVRSLDEVEEIGLIPPTVWPPEEEIIDPIAGTRSIVWRSPDGPIAAILTPAADATRGILLLSGADGGFNGPESGLYEELVRQFHAAGVTTLRVAYRRPTVLDLSIVDARIGLRHLLEHGISSIGVVGFSFGGAVAIETAAQAAAVRAVLTLSSQNAGTEHVGAIAPRPLAVIHAANDSVVPAWAAHDIFDRAGRPKELIILPTADHYLNDADPRLAGFIVNWLLKHVPAGVTT